MCCTEVVNEYAGLYRCAESTLQYVKEHGKGNAACYLDCSEEMGAMLTEMYTGEYMVNVIDSKNGNSDDNLVDYALELLGKAKKLDDAIYLLLGKIGKQCGLDRVSILEANPDYNSLRYSYQWARNTPSHCSNHSTAQPRIPWLDRESATWSGTTPRSSPTTTPPAREASMARTPSMMSES